MGPETTPEQQQVVAAVQASPELASIFSKLLKDAKNNPATLAQHLTRNLQDALSTLPETQESPRGTDRDEKQGHASIGIEASLPQTSSHSDLNGDVLASIRQEGFQEGLQHSVMAFGHHIKTLASGISGGQKKWVFPKEYASQFEAQGIDYEVTPVPQLLEALGQTIHFWSFGNRLGDLGIDDERFPNNLAEIMSKACESVNSGKLVGDYARVDMSSEYNLEEFQLESGISTRLEGLSDFAVNKSLFNLEVAGGIGDDDHRRQLGAIIRMACVIASAIDGAGFSKVFGETPVVSFSAAVISGNRLQIKIGSDQNHNISFIRDINRGQAGKVGMKMTELLGFLSKGFLYDLNVTVSEPLIAEHKYSASFELDMPPWLIPPQPK